MDGGSSSGGGVFLSPLFIFLIVFVLQTIDGFLEIVKKKGLRSPEEIQLRKEIKELLKEASSLSTPSTFAQSAKLRRQAATKERELLKKQEEHKKEKIWIFVLCGKALLALKVVLYGGLVLRFWGVHVAAIPQHLLQPFGKVFSWKAGDAATGQIMVGIVPWLVLTSRVSKFLWHKSVKALFSD
ncbi:tail-anchored protein insertion receptor WRB [Canna indica]|uniref:Tail-anchored protein insertion receptor WRB n=1 Tax=Canna indica TaxID=4628 RepID=A0AAQ3Q153_9LILI|nr:tail-anchored protein insertion receptor WRB [Canna indica]